MQTSKEHISSQQLVLAFLGYYNGKIDGIWSQASIDAKVKFEGDESFVPAYPNAGLPFGTRDKLPKDWYVDNRGNVKHKKLSEEKTRELLAARGPKQLDTLTTQQTTATIPHDSTAPVMAGATPQPKQESNTPTVTETEEVKPTEKTTEKPKK